MLGWVQIFIEKILRQTHNIDVYTVAECWMVQWSHVGKYISLWVRIMKDILRLSLWYSIHCLVLSLAFNAFIVTNTRRTYHGDKCNIFSAVYIQTNLSWIPRWLAGFQLMAKDRFTTRNYTQPVGCLNSDTQWCHLVHRYWSMFVRVIECFLIAPRNCLNQCWYVINWALGNKFQ